MTESTLARYTYRFGWNKQLGLYYLDTVAHYSDDHDIAEYIDISNGVITPEDGLCWDKYTAYAESFHAAYELINEWIKNKETNHGTK